MAVTGISVEIVIDTAAAAQSIASLAAALDASPQLAERLSEGPLGSIILGTDLSGLFRCETVNPAAGRAGEFHGLRIVPDDRYSELVAAIVAHGDAHVSVTVHGWPILSVVARTNTVAEAGPAASGAGGGQRA